MEGGGGLRFFIFEKIDFFNLFLENKKIIGVG